MKKIMLLASLLGSVSYASQVDDLNSKIMNLSTTTEALQADVPSAFDRLNAKANLVANHLDHGTLLIGDYVAGSPGDIVMLPFLLVPSSFPVSDIQADIIVPAALSISSMTAGASALLSEKSVSTGTVNGAERFLVFGLNQNIIPQGEIVLLSISIPVTAPIGLYPIVIDNPIASDPNGNQLLMSVMSGIVEVK